MPKQCNAKGCSFNVFGGGYCQRHQYMRKDRKPKAIKKFSDKRTKINVEYNRESRQYREANPFCRINSPVCTGKTQGVHHLKGKSTIALLMDKDFWKPACNACNGFCEDNADWAIKTGNKLSKHN